MAGSASVWEKYLIIPGLVLDTVLAFILLGAKVNHWTASSKFAEVVGNNRTTIGIVTQIVSQILGMILVTALCKYRAINSKGFKAILTLQA